MDYQRPDSANPLADEGGTCGWTRRLQRMDLPGETPFRQERQSETRGRSWTLDTTPPMVWSKEAWLVVRASDYPLEQHIHFSDDRHLDFGVG